MHLLAIHAHTFSVYIVLVKLLIASHLIMNLLEMSCNILSLIVLLRLSLLFFFFPTFVFALTHAGTILKILQYHCFLKVRGHSLSSIFKCFDVFNFVLVKDFVKISHTIIVIFFFKFKAIFVV